MDDTIKGLPVQYFENQTAWETWLSENHQHAPGLWVKIAKKDTGISSVTYLEVVESGLCYGWIDSQGRSLDDQFYLQKMTPRGPRSRWSKINCDRAEALIAAGRMQPAGQRQVDLAKADGRWENAYDPPSKIEVPPDFQAALEANPAARDFFNTLSGTNRYAFLYRVTTAKKPETRAARIEKFVEMLASGQTIY